MTRKLEFEMVDDRMADVLRAKTPEQRLAIGFGLWRSARVMLSSMLRSAHPEWDEARLNTEVARRMSHGAV
jgi:hypothetical protein